MKSTLKLLYGLALAAFFMPAAGADQRDTWRWYFSTFGSPELKAKFFYRSGTATVAITGSEISISMHEADGSNSNFTGKISDQKVNGKITNFHPSGGELYEGKLKSFQAGSCKFEQIELSNGIPDGSILMLSKIRGHCQ